MDSYSNKYGYSKSKFCFLLPTGLTSSVIMPNTFPGFSDARHIYGPLSLFEVFLMIRCFFLLINLEPDIGNLFPRCQIIVGSGYPTISHVSLVSNPR